MEAVAVFLSSGAFCQTLSGWRDPTRTAFLQFVTHVKLPLIVFYDKDGHFNGPAQFGMSSDANAYKARMRSRLDELLSQTSTP